MKYKHNPDSVAENILEAVKILNEKYETNISVDLDGNSLNVISPKATSRACLFFLPQDYETVRKAITTLENTFKYLKGHGA